MALRLTKKTFGTNLFKNNRGKKNEWHLAHVYFLHSFTVKWGPAPSDARVVCKPIMDDEFVLATATEGQEVTFDYSASRLWKIEPFLGDGTVIRLESNTAASCYIEITAEVERREDRVARLAAKAEEETFEKVN